MSFTRQITIWCDADQCAWWEMRSGTVKSVRKALHKEGWKTAGKTDFCPDCAAKLKGK